MKVAVESNQESPIGVRSSQLAAHLPDHIGERHPLLVRTALGGELRGLRLKDGTQLVDATKVAVTEIRHQRAAARQNHHEALPLQPS